MIKSTFVLPKFSKESGKQLLRDPWPFVAGWVAGGLLAIFLPLILWNRRRSQYYTEYGYVVEYENAQRAYEEANRDNNNNDDSNQLANCSWWNWGCRKRAYYSNNDDNNNNSQQNQDGVSLPNWFLFLGGLSDEDRREREERRGQSTGTSPALTFVYAWSIILFVAMFLYGVYVLVKGRSPRALLLSVVLFAQFALLNLVLMGQGVIETDGRAIDDSVYGWSGQIGVLMAYTNFWFFLYCVLASIALLVRMVLLFRQSKRSHEKEDAEEGGYVHYENPKIIVDEEQQPAIV
jgi:hypothetical protein